MAISRGSYTTPWGTTLGHVKDTGKGPKTRSRASIRPATASPITLIHAIWSACSACANRNPGAPAGSSPRRACIMKSRACDPALRRHLMRIWLSAPEGRELPAVFAERYGEIADGARRGGIMVPGVALSAPLDAE